MLRALVLNMLNITFWENSFQNSLDFIKVNTFFRKNRSARILHKTFKFSFAFLSMRFS